MPNKRRSPHTIRTSKNREAFIGALREGYSIAHAAKLTGVGRQSVYEWRRDDESFANDWDSAVEVGTDSLEDEAIKRARSGSDTLLIFLLKARRPNKYKDRVATEHSGKVTHKRDVDPAELTQAIASKLAGLTERSEPKLISGKSDAE
jgi:transposase-like protein